MASIEDRNNTIACLGWKWNVIFKQFQLHREGNLNDLIFTAVDEIASRDGSYVSSCHASGGNKQKQ
jgi:hypothetical protein